MYYPEENGFIAVTNNEGGSEWWTSDALGGNWVASENNPLAEFGCTMVGRHSPVIYNGSFYFAANCGEDNLILRLTGSETVEIEYTYTAEEGQLGGFPTATVLDNKLYMFTNGGHAVYDGTTWTMVTDSKTNQKLCPLRFQLRMPTA